MKRFIVASLAAAAITASLAASAFAWHVSGCVRCEGTGEPLSGLVIQAESTDGAGFLHAAVTDENGCYSIVLPDVPGAYALTALLYNGETVVTPGSGGFVFSTNDANTDFEGSFVIASQACGQGACWLTGGGAKFSPICNIPVAECGRQHSFGGNVNPGCSPFAGDGGNWNDIAAALKLHFQGRSIQVLRCGNIAGIPPGSESPVTPFNYIEFTGTGTLKGIQGNKADYGTVYFFGHCEDRNEPGSKGVRDGAFKDRYFLHVYSNPASPNTSTLMLIDVDGNPATIDPVTITDGNLQIHISSCDAPPPFRASSGPRDETMSLADRTPALREFWFAAGPNPAGIMANVHFGLPRESDVSIKVFDIAGRAIADVVSGRYPAGDHNATWNLRDGSGRAVDRGVYFLRMAVDGQTRSQRLSIN